MTKIYCDAKDCVYNQAGVCIKDYIDLKDDSCDDYEVPEREKD